MSRKCSKSNISNSCQKFNSSINEYPEILSMISFILIFIKVSIYYSSLLLKDVDFFLPQAEKFDKSIYLFSLAFLKLELLFEVFFQNLAKYISIVAYNRVNVF